MLSGHHGLKSQGFPKVRSKKLASSSFMFFYLGINFMDILHLGNKLVPSPTLWEDRDDTKDQASKEQAKILEL